MGFNIQIMLTFAIWAIVLTAAGYVADFQWQRWQANTEQGDIRSVFKGASVLSGMPSPDGWYALGSGLSDDTSGWQHLNAIPDEYIDGDRIVVGDMQMVLTDGHGLAHYNDLDTNLAERVNSRNFNLWRVGLVESPGNWIAIFGVTSPLSEEDCMSLYFLDYPKIQGVLYSQRASLRGSTTEHHTHPVPIPVSSPSCVTTNFMVTRSGISPHRNAPRSTDCMISFEEMTVDRAVAACAVTDPVVNIGFLR